MSDTILSGNWTVYYLGENRQKRLVWTGGAAAPDSMLDVFNALQVLFHQGTQMDDGSFMTKQTPTEFTFGISDAGDKNPAFISPDSVEHMKTGSLKTASWLRVTTSNVGIVRFDYTVGGGTDLVPGDIGKTIVHTDGDSGTLLDFVTDGSNGTAWVRPDSFAAGDDWDSTGATISVPTGSGAGLSQDAAATSGEMQWTGVYNTEGIATLLEDTHQYFYQGVQSGDTAPDALVTAYKDDQDWFADGQIDTNILVADQSSDLTSRATFIDEGFASVFARKFTGSYSFVVADLFSGSRTPLAMETGNDLNVNEGYGSVTLGTSAGNWNVGDEVEGQTDGGRAIITATSGSNPTITLEFYYIGKSPPIPFDGSEAINNNDDSGTSASSGAVTNVNAAALAGLGVTFGADNTFDVDQDGTNEYYSIVLDVSDEVFTDAYPWVQYTYRRGNTGTGDSDGIEAEQYIGISYRIEYTVLSGTMAEGSTVTQQNSGARGTIVAHHTTPKILTLRNTRGDFNDTDQIDDDGSADYVTGPTSFKITPIKSSPLGLFAGGKWFFAPGVVPNNRVAGDANQYETTDDEGNTEIKEPVQIALDIGDTRIDDWITIHRLTAVGGEIEKDTYNITGAGVSKGANSIVVSTAIAVDEPGKTAGGHVVVNDISAQREDYYRFSSWATSTFTLAQTFSGTATGGDTDTLIDSGASFLTTAKVGDLVRDTDNDESAYVLEIVGDDELTTTVKTTSWSGVAYVANDVIEDYVTADEVYVPLMYVYETAGTDASPGSESVSLVYDADIPALLRGRNSLTGGSYKIEPFSVEVLIGTGGLNQNIIRNPQT